jgi:hypothetical protein
MSVRAAIDAATRLLPGSAVESGPDLRWQAIIDVGEFAKSNPTEVWEFVAVWGCSPDADLRSAVATCVLEHLLEYHFPEVFPLAAALARVNTQFAQTVRLCWHFGEAERPENASAFAELLSELRMTPNNSLDGARGGS